MFSFVFELMCIFRFVFVSTFMFIAVFAAISTYIDTRIESFSGPAKVKAWVLLLSHLETSTAT